MVFDIGYLRKVGLFYQFDAGQKAVLQLEQQHAP